MSKLKAFCPFSNLDCITNPSHDVINAPIWHEVFKNENTISYEEWPKYDESKLVDDTFTMIVQVNGKVRGKVEVSPDTTKDQTEELAFNLENVKLFTDGKEIVKVITVPKKLVNIVVK